MSKHIPILFSTEMVQAILEGRKTQTRRVVKPQLLIGTKWWEVYDGELNYRIVDESAIRTLTKCPYGQPGDVLWVREGYTWVLLDHAHDLLEGARDHTQWVYKASMHPDWMEYAKEKYGYKWTPGIHMPKSACRIFLKVISVQVERLQDISEQDAIAEGIQQFTKDGKIYKYGIDGWDWSLMPRKAKDAVSMLWAIINGQESWDYNPWVWVVEFERCEKPDNFI